MYMYQNYPLALKCSCKNIKNRGIQNCTFITREAPLEESEMSITHHFVIFSSTDF